MRYKVQAETFIINEHGKTVLHSEQLKCVFLMILYGKHFVLAKILPETTV